MLGLGSSISHPPEHEQRYSIALDGVNDLVQTNFLLDKDRSFTISIWYKTSVSSHGKFFGAGSTHKIGLGLSGDIALYTYNSGTAALITFPSSWDDGNWHHIAYYYDKDDADDVKFWFDGSPVTFSYASNNSSGGDATNPTFTLGAENGFDDSSGYTGSYGDFAAWNTELTNAQVAGIYNAGKYHNLKFDHGDYNQASNLNYFIRMGNGIGDMSNENDIGSSTINVVLLQNQVGALSVGFGDELIFNGGYDASVTLGETGSGWVDSSINGFGATSEITFNGGGLKFDKVSGSQDETVATAKTAGGADISIAANNVYRIQHDVLAVSGGSTSLSTRCGIGGCGGSSKGSIYSAGTGASFVTYHRFLTNEFELHSVGPNDNASVTIDNVSVKQVANGDIAIVKNGGALEAEY